MDEDVRETIDLLRAIAAEPLPTGPVELSHAYLRAVEAVENDPANRDGADKSWVFSTLRRNAAFFARGHLAR